MITLDSGLRIGAKAGIHAIDRLAASCRSAGLDVQTTRGLEYNPLTQRYWLSSDTSVNYLFATRRAA